MILFQLLFEGLDSFQQNRLNKLKERWCFIDTQRHHPDAFLKEIKELADCLDINSFNHFSIITNPNTGILDAQTCKLLFNMVAAIKAMYGNQGGNNKIQALFKDFSY